MSLTVFLNMVVEIMPVTSDNPLLGKKENQVKNLCLLHSSCYVLLSDNYIYVCASSHQSYLRHICQLHNVHGGLQRGHHHHDHQLPPSTC